ncbi:MAG: glycosyltransferase family 4 protein [Verrucomicrobiia bacterium]
MKILQLHNAYRIAGGEDAVVQRERSLLQQRGHQVITVERSNAETDGWPAWRRSRLLLDTFFSIESYRRVREICQRERPDVAHVHNVFFLLSPSVYYALDREGVPMVQTFHNFRFLCPNAIFHSGGGLCERCLAGNYLHAVAHRCYHDSRTQSLALAASLAWHRYGGHWWDRIDAFIALSQFSRQKLIEGGLPEDRMFLKPHFLDSASAPPFVNGDYVVVMGRLHPEKDVQTAVEAFQHLPDLQLLVLGDGPLMEPLKALAQRLGLRNVEFRGFVGGTERFEILRHAKLLVLPSRVYENFSVSVLEAYAMGKPVVASRIGAIAEMVEEGVTGLLFEPGQSADLARKIRQLVEQPEHVIELGRAARAHFERHFTADTNYRQLMDIYDFARRRRESRRNRGVIIASCDI